MLRKLMIRAQGLVFR